MSWRRRSDTWIRRRDKPDAEWREHERQDERFAPSAVRPRCAFCGGPGGGGRDSGGRPVLFPVPLAERPRRDVGGRPASVEPRHAPTRWRAKSKRRSSARTSTCCCARGSRRGSIRQTSPGSIRCSPKGLAASPFIEELWFWSENAGERPRTSSSVFDRASLQAPARPSRPRASANRRAPQRRSCRMVRELGDAAAGDRRVSGEIDGRAEVRAGAAAIRGPNRERVSSFLGFMVDAEQLRTTYFPSADPDGAWRRCSSRSGSRRCEIYLLDGDGRCHRSPAPTPLVAAFVDERSSRWSSSIASCSSTRRRTNSAARPGAIRTSYGAQTFRRSSAPARGRSWR